MGAFDKSEKNYSRQLAVGYIVFMMAGSYFCQSGSSRTLQNLYLHYAEMPQQKQYQYEERVIRAMEQLDSKFLRRIAGLRFRVSGRFDQEDYLLNFSTGGFESLQCRIQKNGTFRLIPLPLE